MITPRLDVSRTLSTGAKVLVGQLAQNESGVYFQYDADYLTRYASLSPFSLPFNNDLSKAPRAPHLGLHGLFGDSLPDGWGLLLMDRAFDKKELGRHQISGMDRLAYMGQNCMGALCYSPSLPFEQSNEALTTLTELGQHAIDVFDGSADEVLPLLAQAGGSGGARPKALISLMGDKISTDPGVSPHQYLVKFTSANLMLGHDEGVCEAAYLSMAQRCGIDVPDWRLFDSPVGPGWLGLKRFDCTERGRLHMHTLCGLFDASFREPSMDYEGLIKAAQVLTQSPSAGQAVFKRAMFNLFCLNQDDHTKNWSFLMDDQGQWQLAPFYDVTYSPTPHNNHMMSFVGHGHTPPLKTVQKLATLANFSHWPAAKAVIGEVVDALSQWPQVAKTLGVKTANIAQIAAHLEQVRKDNSALL